MITEQTMQDIFESDPFILWLPANESEFIDMKGEEYLELAITFAKHIIVFRESGIRHWLPHQLDFGRYSDYRVVDGDREALVQAVIEYTEASTEDEITFTIKRF